MSREALSHSRRSQKVLLKQILAWILHLCLSSVRASAGMKMCLGRPRVCQVPMVLQHKQERVLSRNF